MRNYLLAVVAAILLVLILIGMPGRQHFKLSADEMLDRVLSQQQIIGPGQFETLMQGDQAVLIDMSLEGMDFNTPDEKYIRLPVPEMNLKIIHELIDKNHTYIIYSDKREYARQAWILLAQLGWDNIKILEENSPGTDETPRFTFTPN